MNANYSNYVISFPLFVRGSGTLAFATALHCKLQSDFATHPDHRPSLACMQMHDRLVKTGRKDQMQGNAHMADPIQWPCGNEHLRHVIVEPYFCLL